MIMILILTFFMTAYIKCQTPYVTSDLDYIQCQSITLYSNSAYLASNINVTSQYLKSFNSLPQINTGIIQLDVNFQTYYLSFLISQINITQSNLVFKVIMDSNTHFYALSICYTATVIPTLEFSTKTFSIIFCLAFPCNLYLDLNHTAISYIGHFSLVGISFQNAISNNTFNLNFQMAWYYAGYYIYFQMVENMTINNFTIKYSFIPYYQTQTTIHYTTSSAGLTLTNMSNIYNMGNDLYSTGYSSSQSESFLGLQGFNYKSNQPNIKFSATILTKQFKIQNLVNTTSTMGFQAIIYGVIKCPANSKIVYDGLGVATCIGCATTCLTCSGSGSSACLTCDASLKRYLTIINVATSSGNCVCLSQYYDTGSACVACATTCLTCSGSGSSACLTCDASSMRYLTIINVATSSGNCVCLSQYYDTGSACVACATTCLTCSGSGSSACLTCDASSMRYLTIINVATSSGNCVCLSQYYDTGSACVACATTCLTCSGSGSSACLTCDASSMRYLTIINVATSSGNCVCLSQYYDTGSACVACATTCLTCSGSGSSACLTCDASSMRYLTIINVATSSGNCVCLSQYYDTGSACVACATTCLTCSGSGSSACLTCDASSMRYLTIINVATSSGNCVCLSQYYDTGSACVACATTCLTCSGSGSSACLTCDASSMRYLTIINVATSSGNCVCLSQYYDTGSACVACATTCLTCSGSGSSACLTCDASSMRYLTIINVATSSGNCVCLSQYYDTGSACVACATTCLTCSGSGSSACLTCDASSMRYLTIINVATSSGNCVCLSQYYDTGSACVACATTCLTCSGSGSSACLTCDASSMRYLTIINVATSSGNCVCLSQYYDTGSACVACATTCLTCSGSGSSACLTCDASSMRYLTIINVATSSGNCVCLSQYYDTGSACVACATTCLTCSGSGSSACLTCDASSMRYLTIINVATSSGNCVCLSQYYDTGSACVACATTCLTCSGSGSSACLTCDASLKRYLTIINVATSSGNCVCLSQYYDTGSACVACATTCLTCSGSGSSACLTCDASSMRYLTIINVATSSGNCVCLSQYYDTGSACVACATTCLTCSGSGSSACLTCDASSMRYLTIINVATSSGNCVCLSQYYDTGSACVACATTCLTCSGSGSSACLTCDASSMRYLTIINVATSSGNCVCLSQYYDTGSVCVACATTCLTCNAFSCLSCSFTLHRYLYITDNINLGGDCLCIPGYVQFNQVCVSCDTSCYQCAYDPTHCTNCFPGYQLISNRCVSFCILRYLFDGHNGCIICPQGCSSCSNTSTCSTFTCSIGIYSQHNCVDQCPFSTFELADINSCQECVHPCLQCSNFTTCISCYMGFYLNTGNNFCYPCSLGCFNCTTPDTCFQCGYFYILMNGTCIIKSACMLNLYVCSDCSNNCVNCSLTECYECSTAFLLLNGSCHTCNISGLQLINNQCIEVCGDGKKILNECDDGNVIDGDGCSKNCSIQENYYCEGDKNHPDFCWPSNSQLNVDIAKSLINNSVKITLTSRSLTFTNIVDLSINCENDIKQNNTYIYINQNTSYSIIIAYSRQFVNRRCNITIATHPIQEILIATMPKSYYYDPSLLNFIIRMSVVLKYLSLISTVTILVTHFFSNAQSTVLFMEALFIYIFSLFNCKYISPVVYNFIPELKYFLLMYNTNTDVFRNQSFSDGLIFMLKKNSFQTNTQSIFIVFLLYLLITIFLMAISQSVNESLSKLYTRNLIQYRLFFYNTYSLFEPMLLFCFLNNIYHTTQTISIVLQIVFIFILIIASGYLLYFSSFKNTKILNSRGGGLIKFKTQISKRGINIFRTYWFIILTFLYNQECIPLYPLFLSTLYNLIMPKNKRKLNVQPLKKKLIKYQYNYNEVFILINSSLIYLLYWISNIQNQYFFNYQTIGGFLNIVNLTSFILVNLAFVIFNFFYRIYRIYKKNKNVCEEELNVVHKQQEKSQEKIQKSEQVDFQFKNFYKKSVNDSSNGFIIKNQNFDEASTKIIFDI